MAKKIRVVHPGLAPGQAALGQEAAHYVTRVHRLRAGDRLLLVDPWQGTEAEAVLLQAGAKPQVQIELPRAGARRGLQELELVQGLGKGDKLDRVVRDAVALGAGRLWVVQTERSVPRVLDRAEARTSRWDGIALDAVRQSQRAELPAITGPVAVQEVLQQTPDALRVFLQPAAGAQPLLQVLSQGWSTPAPAGRVLQLWVGPEGGFSEAETQLLHGAGALPGDLGPMILRTETAATVALALAAACLWQLRQCSS